VDWETRTAPATRPVDPDRDGDVEHDQAAVLGFGDPRGRAVAPGEGIPNSGLGEAFRRRFSVARGGYGTDPPKCSHREREHPVQRLFAGAGRGVRAVGGLAARAERGGVDQNLTGVVQHPQPGQVATVQLGQDAAGVSGLDPVAGFQGGGKEAPFLGHGPLLGFEKVLLVGVQEEQTARGEEDQQEVEGKEPNRNPERPAHQVSR
jgi:hypothetical protein